LKLDLGVEGVEAEVAKGNLVIVSRSKLKTLSSAVLNGGLVRASSIINHQVTKDFNHSNPEEYLAKVVASFKLPEPAVGLMTTANVEKLGFLRLYAEGVAVAALVTAGLSNAAAAGEALIPGAGTINTIVVVDADLTDGCMVEAVKMAVEAKCSALSDLDVRSSTGRLATGTSTDALVIACTERGKRFKYCGTGTELGLAVAKVVKEATVKAIEAQEGLTPGRPLVKRLEERGISVEELVKAGMELYVHHPSMGGVEKARETLRRLLEEALSDVNVAALILAASRIEDDGRRGLIPGLPAQTFSKDPVHLLADEVLGMGIANYIAGSKGLFEYVRFDKAKPGVIGKVGPFMDDALAALVGGASSNMYSELLKKASEKR